MSHRLQVTLDDAQYADLLAESRRTGAPIAELVRRAVGVRFGRGSVHDRLAALDAAAGGWGTGSDGLVEQAARRAKRRSRHEAASAS